MAGHGNNGRDRTEGVLSDHIVGTYSEFFLVVSICEEALYELGKRAVEAVSAYVLVPLAFKLR